MTGTLRYGIFQALPERRIIVVDPPVVAAAEFRVCADIGLL